MTDTRRSRVPPQIRTPYASRLSGKWKGHRTAGGAWRRVWSHRNRAGTMVVRVDPDTGLGELLEPPEKQPGGASGGAPGERVSPRRVLTAPREKFERWDRQAAREGVSWAVWARAVMDGRCDWAGFDDGFLRSTDETGISFRVMPRKSSRPQGLKKKSRNRP